ncbi:tail protein [Prochlorococcus phage P-SSP10]|uniref:Tubular tail protein B n=1 Tax=Prochlorococcus phage P-SSP10 TaxID=885867 RepID=M1UH51_9CAUD|nr:tail protein [Prochlorococcus phage P-SSP10]AGG54662.1 tubular tail protein B [Prochlorococcus phage P-SSP10]
MAAINQRIPNFLGGVSQQPDSIKFPGQLRACDNAVPDVTFGLMKRPPGEFVKTLTSATDDGYWYEILRDGDEKFLVQMTAATSYTGTKPIRIWNLLTGVEQTLTNADGDTLFHYMHQTTAGGNTIKPYGVQTIQDYTLICNPQKTISTLGNTHSPLNSGDYAFARLDTIAYNTEYVLYTGSAPAANTYYRVTSLKVDYTGTRNGTMQGATWDDANEDGRYAGQIEFSMSSGGQNIWLHVANSQDIEGTLLVNGQTYIDSQNPQYQGESSGSTSGSGNGSDFIGYTSDYNTRYSATVTLKNGGLIFNTNKLSAMETYIDIELEGKWYRIHVEGVEPVETYQGVSGIAYFKTAQSPDKGRASMATILKGLESAVNNDLADVTAEIYGSGLYLYGTAAPNVNFLGGAVNEAMNVFGNTAQDVSRLPSMCKHGYIVQVANSENLDADNYYVKFIADNGSGGSGKWEETVRPHNFSSGSDPMVKGFNDATMPHALVNNRDNTFTFKKLDEATANTDGNDNYWKYREVGDDETNPFPSFNGKNIQKIFFHRNRLGMIADEQVVMSRPGDYFNFFVVSAITISDDNPVDITVSDIKPAFINHVLPIQKGVMMFSDNGQFILFTESDIFSPKTARLKKISSYECDDALQPVDMGTSVMFSSGVSAYTRTYEATVVDDDIPPKIVEQTRVVPEYVPKDVNVIANTTALGIVSYGTKGSPRVFHYKYFDAGERRDQSAWYSWSLTGHLQHMVYTAGSYYVVTKINNDFVLCRHEYVTDTTGTRSYTVGGLETNVGSPYHTARWFEPCLDCLVVPSAITYTAAGGGNIEKTVLTLPYTPLSTDTNFYAVGLNGTNAGVVVTADSVGTNSATFNGINMTGWEVVVGYNYTTLVELPDYHFTLEANRYDTDGSLRISGMNFDLGVSGPMEFHLTAKNSYTDANGTVTPEFDDYIQYESGMQTGLANFGTVPSALNKTVRVPIQKKNTKYNLQIKVTDPFSTALISASWDGIYNQRRHARK